MSIGSLFKSEFTRLMVMLVSTYSNRPMIMLIYLNSLGQCVMVVHVSTHSANGNACLNSLGQWECLSQLSRPMPNGSFLSQISRPMGTLVSTHLANGNACLNSVGQWECLSQLTWPMGRLVVGTRAVQHPEQPEPGEN
jgi:hypothetical protein